jgi:hypothetical protein
MSKAQLAVALRQGEAYSDDRWRIEKRNYA